MTRVPSEFMIGEVYLPPLLIAALLGLVATMLTLYLLNHFRLSRFFAYPPLVLLSLMAIYTVAIGTWIIPS